MLSALCCVCFYLFHPLGLSPASCFYSPYILYVFCPRCCLLALFYSPLSLILLILSPWAVSCLLFLFPLYPLCFLSAVLSFSFVLFSAVLNFTYFIPLGCLPLLAFIHPVFRPLRRLLPTFLRHSTLLLCFSLSPLTLFSMHIFQCKVCIELIVTKFSHMAYN